MSEPLQYGHVRGSKSDDSRPSHAVLVVWLLPAHHRSLVFLLRTSLLASNFGLQWPLPPAPHCFPGKKILSHGHRIVAVRGNRQTEHLSLYNTLLFKLTLQPCSSCMAISQYDINPEFTTQRSNRLHNRLFCKSLNVYNMITQIWMHN